MIMRLICILFIAALLLNCSIDPVVQEADTIGDYFAYCTLMPYSEKQTVLVGRTVPESLPYWYNDVEITLSGLGKTSQFRCLGSGKYEEILPALPITGGSVYTLNVLFPDGHRITATTRVPGDFTILEPTHGDTLYYQIGPRKDPKFKHIFPVIEWSPSERAYYYVSNSIVKDGPCGGGIAFTNYTKISIPFYPYNCWVEGAAQLTDYYTHLTLFVVAIDSSRGFHAQRRYWLGPEDLPDYDPVFDRLEENSVKPEYLDIHGGMGFFNAVNRAECDFVLHVKVVEPDSGEVE